LGGTFAPKVKILEFRTIPIQLLDYYGQIVTVTDDVSFAEVSVNSIKAETSADILTDPSLFQNGPPKKSLPLIF
jgi:hypothetical protein